MLLFEFLVMMAYNRQIDSPESLLIAPPHLIAALVAMAALPIVNYEFESQQDHTM